MRPHLWVAASLTLSGVVSCHRTVAPDGAQAAPLLSGRFVPEGAGAVRFAWSASRIAARFTGTSVGLKLRDATDTTPPGRGNTFDVVVDDQAPLVLRMDPATRVYPIASNLAAGPHTITVTKRTEAFVGESIFDGLQLEPNGHLLAPPAAARRHLEIIGDSISAGYGDEGADAHCGFTPQTENANRTYGVIAARAVEADVTVLAWSGKGVLRNHDGTTTETLPQLYERALPGRVASTWDFHQARMDAVVVNLGTNDFGPGIPEAAAFQQAYTNLLRTLRRHYPKAYIVCAIGPMLSDAWPAGQHQLSVARAYITAAVRQMGDARITVLEFPMQTGTRGYGCDWHPSLATHAAMAAQLTAALRAILH